MTARERRRVVAKVQAAKGVSERRAAGGSLDGLRPLDDPLPKRPTSPGGAEGSDPGAGCRAAPLGLSSDPCAASSGGLGREPEASSAALPGGRPGR